ncbi:MAG: uncharacterized protein JWN03_3693 [Nocardia sp.]|uniref:ESX secretion-associated protein EspG n=1 Tax=Nocardia sp. TaxID=1821 RepID=UPI00260F5100|nr:ESX secretion-associated protein EspG [Nocardia sp.]MCU1643418.1 uncharacterized protein [Nocardia sp.]
MSATWHFDDLEFLTLWQRATSEWLPSPFIYTSDTSLYYDHLQQQRATAERMFANWDRSFDPALEAIAHPDLRISVDGMDRKDSGAQRIRMMGVRLSSRGYVLEQRTQGTSLDSDGFTVSECDPVGLADALVAGLPDADVGRQAQIPLVYEGAEETAYPDAGRIIVKDVFGDSDTLRTKRFFDAPTVGEGGFDIVQGYSKFGPRGIVKHSLRWRDLQDDGRYIISDEPPLAAPAGAKRMVAAINTRVATIVQKIREERAL